MSRLPEARAEAIEVGSTRYFTGEKCKRGHVAERFTLSGACVECQQEDREDRARRYREAKVLPEPG